MPVTSPAQRRAVRHVAVGIISSAGQHVAAVPSFTRHCLMHLSGHLRPPWHSLIHLGSTYSCLRSSGNTCTASFISNIMYPCVARKTAQVATTDRSSRGLQLATANVELELTYLHIADRIALIFRRMTPVQGHN